ncbi:MAG: AAA family ATPase, partial [Verrucomicrobiales bacterium]|nr:AAA family ATPase [Verrucomicrobiales bacterium]
VGANGSGKSTVLQAIQVLARRTTWQLDGVRTAGAAADQRASIQGEFDGESFGITWRPGVQGELVQLPGGVREKLHRARLFFSLSPDKIAAPVKLKPGIELGQTGENLAGVLERLRDEQPERFESINQELGRWIPEFDRILFETPGEGEKAVALRTRAGGHRIKASDLSGGTLIALALLTLAYLPEPPSIVCLEEPDRGLHPRLLRDVRDALYRLAYPENAGEKREPVQVIATTHNPFFLDLFRDHPEEIVIAEKVGLEVKFSRLSDRPDLNEILGEAPLSEVWFSGVLGGVPTRA